MPHVIRRTLWRASFINALQLVGQASARLPFGVPDPVLRGSSAIELYTGGLWSAADLDLYTLEPGPLIAELFGLGFRWAERPERGGRGLWHPELHIGINIGSGVAPADIAELSNVLIVINDLDLEQHAQASLKAIGIEDLIAAQVVGCSMLRTPFSEVASLTRVLVGLAREGVGGRFRAGYLHRRVAWDTDGAVVLESELSGEAVECDLAPRFTTLTRMQALIEFLASQVWLLVRSAAFRCGTSTARKNDPDGSSPQRRAGRAGGNQRLDAEHHSPRCPVAGFVPVVGRRTASRRRRVYRAHAIDVATDLFGA